MTRAMPRTGILRFAVPTALGVAFALAASLVSSSAGAQALPAKPAPLHHKAKSRTGAKSISLKALPAGQSPAARSGPVSPYERAAAQRAQSGEPPPGHPVVRPPVAAAPN
jgi:hypothetical protein